jgi:hypothetical protein
VPLPDAAMTAVVERPRRTRVEMIFCIVTVKIRM